DGACCPPGAGPAPPPASGRPRSSHAPAEVSGRAGRGRSRRRAADLAVALRALAGVAAAARELLRSVVPLEGDGFFRARELLHEEVAAAAAAARAASPGP